MKQVVLLLLTVSVLFASCQMPTNGHSVLAYPTLDEVVKDNPEKTILIWQTKAVSISGQTLLEANNYLDSIGKEYAVYFESVSFNDWDSYLKVINSKVSSDEQIDILSTGSYMPSATAYSNAYHYYVYEGLYEPLDSYLANTELGQKLYNQMPQGYWDSLTINNSLYGVSPSGMIGYRQGYYVNKKLANKYGWDISKTIIEQLDILKDISVNESNCVTVYLGDDLTSYACYPNAFVNIYGIYYNSTDDTIGRITEDEEWLEWIRLINTLSNEGLLQQFGSGISIENKDTFIQLLSMADGISTPSFGDITTQIAGAPTEESISCFGDINSITPNMVTGICSNSKNKDLAFDLLATVQTDKYLNDLLSYDGGKTNEEDKIYEPGFVGNYAFTFANRMICSPIYYEPIDYIAKFEAILTSDQNPSYWGFAFDVHPVQATYLEVIKVMQDFDYYEAIPFDELISKLDAELDKANIDVLIKEVQLQYDEWSLTTK